MTGAEVRVSFCDPNYLGVGGGTQGATCFPSPPLNEILRLVEKVKSLLEAVPESGKCRRNRP